MRFLYLIVGILIAAPSFAEETIKIKDIDYKNLFANVKDIQSLKKGEFEKSSSFDKRICQLTHQKMGVMENSYIIFPINIPRVKELFYYDADQAFFYVDPKPLFTEPEILWMEGSTSRYDLVKDHNELILFEQTQQGANYSGSNSFGIQKDVNVKFQQALTLAIHTKSYDLDMKIKIPSAQAKIIKNDLRLAVRAKLTSPCFNYTKGKSLPKINKPEESTLEIYRLNAAKNSEWIVYKESDKKILKITKFN